MRLRVVGSVAVLGLACAWCWGAAEGEKAAPPGGGPAAQAEAAQPAGPVALLVNGAPSEGAALVVNGVPLLAAQSAATVVPVPSPGVTIGKTAAGETTLTRPEAIVRVKPEAKQMYVDGQSTPLPTPVVEYQGRRYVPAAVLQALYPEHELALVYRAATNTVLLAYKPKARGGQAPIRGSVPPMAAFPREAAFPRAAAAPAASAACAPSGPGQGVATQEFGKKGAKMEVVAALPITHRCHVRTETELKKAYEKYPNDIHLTIYDLFGAEGQKFVAEHGGQRAVVFVNGKTSFDLDGRKVTLEMQEDRRYRPADIVPIIEQELGAK